MFLEMQMIGRMLSGACAIALVTTTAVMAQPSTGSQSKDDANKQICRTSVDIGSRLARTRACHTAQEWAELRRQARQNVDHIQNSRAANGN
jgi:hypothetical protein